MPQDDELLIIPFIRANFCVYISKINSLSKKSHLYFSDLQKQAFINQ
ncbi:Malolactic regulator [Leuconostoc gelidum subsp. gasicomitatum]|nr:Malolactic regulator [Leuconostoc gasicomitatum]